MIKYKHWKAKAVSTGSLFAFSIALLTTTAVAQTTDEDALSDEDVFNLSPFVILTDEDNGYMANATLAGTRIRTDLKDVGSAVSVITEQFLEDTASTKAEQLLVYTTNTEVSGPQGNFLGGGDGEYVYSSVGGTRVRGLAAADNLRTFFISSIPWDSYNVSRVDIQRGPNSVLFGIGSPAGIINTSLNTAVYEEIKEVKASFDNFGSYRFTADLNREILKDELAVRVALLDDNTKYRQKPAFRDDTRVFTTVTYEPAFLKKNGRVTTIRANYEEGKIVANYPMQTPPNDLITPWFDVMGKVTYPYKGSDKLSSQGQVGYNPWLSRQPYQYNGGLIAIFPDSADANQSMILGSATREYPAATDPSQYSNVGGNLSGIGNYANWAFNTKQPGYGIRPFKTKSITDPSIFDYYDTLLVGPNKRDESTFSAYNLTLSQTLFDNKLGIEVAYDKQRSRYFNWNMIGAAKYAIAVDIWETLGDGSSNPNLGRPYVPGAGSDAGGSAGWNEWETLRVTAFGELDFPLIFNSESLLTRILGRHIFTASGTDYKTEGEYRGWSSYWIADNAGYPGTNPSDRIGADARKLMTSHYIGDSLLGASSYQGLSLDRIHAIQQPSSGYVTQWNTQTRSWQQYPVTVVNANSDFQWNNRPYTGGSKAKDQIKSLVLVWQAHLLDGMIVPMYGWRKDKSYSWNAGAAPEDALGRWQVANPEWRLPNGPDDGWGRSYNEVEGETKTFSVVVHAPKVVTDFLGGTKVSLFYNESENFQPKTGRRDVLGNYIPSPTGETKDMGINLSMLEGKLMLKINRYETKVLNDDASASIPTWVLAYEAWNQHAAWAYKNRDYSDGHLDHLQVRPNFGYTSSNSKYGAGNALIWQPMPDQLVDPNVPWGEGGAYTQESIDYWYDVQEDAIASWLANPIPESMQEAWGMTGYNTPEYKGQFNWGAIGSIAVNGSSVSKGTEIELIAKPIDGLDISLNISKTDAKRIDIGESWSKWVEFRWEQLQTLPLGQMRTWNGADWNVLDGFDIAVDNYRSQLIPYYNLALALNGSNVPELRPWHANIVANYTFQDGNFAGLNIGASYRWMDKQVIGYKLNAQEDGYDVNDKWYGPTESAIDFWMGKTILTNQKFTWRMQVNIRNVFASDDLIPVTVQPDGSAGQFRIPEPRVISISNTISF